jgi:hypothetical protein
MGIKTSPIDQGCLHQRGHFQPNIRLSPDLELNIAWGGSKSRLQPTTADENEWEIMLSEKKQPQPHTGTFTILYLESPTMSLLLYIKRR